MAIVDIKPNDNLLPELKENIDECYVVYQFQQFTMRCFVAVGYFTSNMERSTGFESNNEAWLDLDARLRVDFNVKTGFSYKTIQEYQSKAAMEKIL